MPEPGDAVTWREAAAILDVGIRTVGVLVAQGGALGVNRARVRQLVRRRPGAFRADTSPAHAFRRQQLLTVANAPRARFGTDDIGA
jgi:hypothetical protein